MKIQLTFDTTFQNPLGELAPGGLAQLILDIHRQAIVLATSAEIEQYLSDSRPRRAQGSIVQALTASMQVLEYESLIVLRQTQACLVHVQISAIEMRSPLWIEATLQCIQPLAARFAELVKALYGRIYFGDVERRRRILDNAKTEQEVVALYLKNVIQVMKLNESLNSDELNEAIGTQLLKAIAPFEPNLPRDRPGEVKPTLLKAIVIDDDGKRSEFE